MDSEAEAKFNLIKFLIIMVQMVLTIIVEIFGIVITVKACKEKISLSKDKLVILLYLCVHLTNIISIIRCALIFDESTKETVEGLLKNCHVILRDLIPLLIMHRLTEKLHKARHYGACPKISLRIFMAIHFCVFLLLFFLQPQINIFNDNRVWYFMGVQFFTAIFYFVIYNAFITRFAFCMFKKLKYSLFLILIVHCLRFIANIPVVLYSIVYIKKPLDDSLIFIFLNILFLSVSQYFLWVIIQRPENELPKKKLMRSQNNNPVNYSISPLK